MAYKNFDFKTKDNKKIIGYKWEVNSPKAIVHIVHGMGEHAGRYDEFATFLNNNNISVYAEDHRGHGKTAGTVERVGHLSDNDGLTKVMEDVVMLQGIIKKENPNVPIFLLGHSMGSFIVRLLAYTHPKIGKGYILSATGAHPGVKGTVGIKLVAAIKTFGKRKRSKFLDKITFGDFNKKYKPQRTIKDWISRDTKIVDKYMNDPFCMQIFSAQFFYDLINLAINTNNNSNIAKTDLTKPILFFSGTMDPVGEYAKGVTKVFETYKKLGATNCELKLYEGARHETLNETNKKEVYADVLSWINKQL